MSANVILPQTGAGRKTRIVKEAVFGQAPDSAAWDQLRNTGGEGVQVQVTSEISDELPGDVLGARDLAITEKRGIFTYPFRLTKSAPFELFLESLLGGSFDAVTADTLYPGKEVVTFDLEDELPSVAQSEHVLACVGGELVLTLQARQVITGEMSGAGGKTDLGKAEQVVGSSDVTFATPNTIDFTAGIPAWVVAGKFVQVTDSTSNDGYYKITDVTGTVVTVDGVIVAEPLSSATGTFFSQSLLEQTTGTENAKATNPDIRCGNAISVALDGEDILQYGLRSPEAVITITNELNDLDEITEDEPYGQLKVDRVISVAIQYHVINLEPLYRLHADSEFSLSFTLHDNTGAGYTFAFPRCKTAESTKGPAAKEEMTGLWTIQALLDSSDRNVIVTKTA